MVGLSDDLIWDVRAFVYHRFAETSQPPMVNEIAGRFRLSVGEAASVLRALHDRHALLLNRGTLSIRMANPFSAVPTPFEVHARGRDCWANCAWDALGIPAALHEDARINASDATTGEGVTITIRSGRVQDHGELVHFPLPFSRWYDDLIRT